LQKQPGAIEELARGVPHRKTMFKRDLDRFADFRGRLTCLTRTRFSPQTGRFFPFFFLLGVRPTGKRHS
jgi:hypothetical protein